MSPETINVSGLVLALVLVVSINVDVDFNICIVELEANLPVLRLFHFMGKETYWTFVNPFWAPATPDATMRLKYPGTAQSSM